MEQIFHPASVLWNVTIIVARGIKLLILTYTMLNLLAWAESRDAEIRKGMHQENAKSFIY